MNSRALEWCNYVNSQIHGTTFEIPFSRLKHENLKGLPSIKYYDNHHFKVHKDGSIFFQGQVYRIDESLAGCEGEIIDLNNTVFASVERKIFILSKRNLHVNIRRRYSGTGQTISKQKYKKKGKATKLDRWINTSTEEFKIK